MTQSHNEAFDRAQSILKYLRNESTEAEKAELEAWLAADEANRRLLEQLADEQALGEELRFFESISPADAWEKIAAQTGAGVPRVVPLHRSRRSYWMAAAAVLLIMAGAAIAYRLLQTGPSQEVAKGQEQKQEVTPGGNMAVLTLADGSRIDLGSAADGQLTVQGGTRVVKQGTRLAYLPGAGEKEGGAVLYNTVSTPRGGLYQLQLPDGSLVWLNATSSIRFPAAFSGRERKVAVTGEAYFEVAKNAAMPFTVQAGGAEVRVLGTHFNVMAYPDEAALETTLLEGSVLVAGGKSTRTLRPGQQAQLAKGGALKVADGVNLDEVVAWKNGMFHFDNADIETVMKQLARWYDVDAVHPGKTINDRFVGEISRSAPLPDVLKMLELTSSVHFRLEGKKIIVVP